MPTLLLTVATVTREPAGFRLKPGLFKSDFERSPDAKRLRQGSALEFKRPDGTTQQGALVTYGISVWKQPDGSFIAEGDPNDPEIELTVSVDDDTMPVGTEVWLI